MLLLLRRLFLFIKLSYPTPKRRATINKLCKLNPINCMSLLDNLWTKKTKNLTTNYPHFIYFPMQKSLKISPSKSSGYLIPKNSSNEDLTYLRSSAATSTSFSFEIFSIQASNEDRAALNKTR